MHYLSYLTKQYLQKKIDISRNIFQKNRYHLLQAELSGI